jgi:FkbM family methyltransferase
MQDPQPTPFCLKVLRTIPAFRGKSRIARQLLGATVRNQCTLVRDRYGNQMVVPNLVEPVGFSLGIDGSYEPEVVAVLRSHLSAETDFVDVGANIGAFTVALARSARRVFAVEPSPAVLPFLRRNVELSQQTNIEISEYAASSPEINQVPFYLPPMDHFGMGSSAAQFDVDPVTLPARTLDNMLSNSRATKIAAVKVDVEGFEAHVFLGAADLLRSASAPVIVFEFCDWAEERAFPGRKGWAQQVMLDAGYTLWLLPEYRRQSAPLTAPLRHGFHTIVGCRSRRD